MTANDTGVRIARRMIFITSVGVKPASLIMMGNSNDRTIHEASNVINVMATKTDGAIQLLSERFSMSLMLSI